MTRYVWENEYQPFYHVITLDAQGRCAQVVRVNTDPLRPSGDAEPVTYLFEYDAQGRLIRWTDSEGETQYIYDENGDVKEKIRWNGYAKEYNTKVHTVYERDAAGQPVRVHAETYNAKTGERTKTTDTGYAIEYINDANGRLTGLNRYETGSGRLMQKITYVYDDSGKLIGFTESVGRDEPIPGMEWLKLNDDLRGDTDIIWRTPEAYHAQAEEAE
jgi:YD repeat-containing protein